MLKAERVCYGEQDGLRICALRGVYKDADGEVVGALWDEVEISPLGKVSLHLNCLHGEATEDYEETAD